MPRGHLVPLKGAYLDTKQVDKSAPVKTGEQFVRGSLIKLEAGTGKWVKTVAGDVSTTDTVYAALQDSNSKETIFGDALGGLSLNAPLELETSEFDSTLTYAVGDKLVAKEGKVSKLPTAAGTYRVIGEVTKPVFSRHVNDLLVNDYNGLPSTGGLAAVLTFATRPAVTVTVA